jgi:hypothetical protein
MSSLTEPFLRRLRLRAGALFHDWPAFERRMRAGAWLEIRNRNERIQTDGRGVLCDWRFTSDLHIARVFASAGVRLMRRAFSEWPITLRDRPPAGTPRVSFLIGHRGAERNPHLQATLRSIAGQTLAVECIVVEQSAERSAEVPPWVHYVHTPVPSDQPYSRARAFNSAARLATTGVLICHDNDMLVPEQYAAEALARIEEDWQFLDLKRFLFYLGEEDTMRFFRHGQVRTDVATTVVQNARGGSIVADAAAYRAIGGFDPSFVGWGGEDNDFWDRAETTGRVYSFGYLPMIHLYHSFQAGKWSETEAVARYRALESVPARERIERLLREDQR